MSFLPQVRSGERTRFLYASVAFMCVAAGGLIARTVGDTVFLTRFGADRLPPMYLGTSVLIAAIGFGVATASSRWPLPRILATTAAILVALTVALRFSMGDTASADVAVYFLAEVVIRLPLLLFWVVAALTFDSREAKRLLGTIGAAGTFGCIVAGTAIPSMVDAWGTENLLWAQALLLGGFGAAAAGAARSAPSGDLTAQVAHLPRARLSSAGRMMTQPQIRSLCALAVVASVSLVVVDFIFKAEARSHFSGTSLASFFGQFYAIANAGALLLQLFLVHRILSRGVGLSLRILPTGLLVAATGMLVFNTTGWAIAGKLLEPLFEFTINAAAFQMLFLAVPRQSRTGARALVDGVARPLAFAVGGVLLALSVPLLTTRHLAAVVLITSAVWLWLARREARLYSRHLLQSIRQRRLDPLQERVGLPGSVVREEVRQALRTAPDDDVPYLLSLLPHWPSIDWRPEYRLLLERDSPELKALALEHLADHGEPCDGERVSRELQHVDAGVRRAAVGAARRAGGPDGGEWLLVVCEHDPDPSVRSAAAAELINHGDLQHLIRGATAFRAMLVSPHREERLAAAGSLVVVRGHTLTGTLRQLLEDPDVDVRLTALDAIRSRPSPELISAVVSLLRDRRTAWKAAEVLPMFGEAALAEVSPLVDEALSIQPPAHRFHLPPILERIGPAGLPELGRLQEASDEELYHAAIRAWCVVIRRHDVKGETRRTEELARRELERASAAARARGGKARGDELLQLALQDGFHQHVDAMLRLLQIVEPAVDPTILIAGLRKGGEQRAHSLEFLESVLPRHWRTDVLSLFEDVASLVRPELPLGDLLTGTRSEWVVAGAAYCVGEACRTDLSELVRSLTDHPSTVVRETAADALRKLQGVMVPAGAPARGSGGTS